MNDDLGRVVNHVTKKHRYVLVYLIFQPQGAILNGRAIECFYGADCLEEIIKREKQLRCANDFMGIVGLQNSNGDYV